MTFWRFEYLLLPDPYYRFNRGKRGTFSLDISVYLCENFKQFQLKLQAEVCLPGLRSSRILHVGTEMRPLSVCDRPLKLHSN